jgi:hypothetical protein
LVNAWFIRAITSETYLRRKRRKIILHTLK